MTNVHELKQRVTSLARRSDYVMPFVDASMWHVTKADAARLDEIHHRDMNDERTEDVPFVAKYPEGYFVWVHGEDKIDLQLNIRKMRSLSRSFRDMLLHFADAVGHDASMTSVFVRLDRDGSIIPGLKLNEW